MDRLNITQMFKFYNIFMVSIKIWVSYIFLSQLVFFLNDVTKNTSVCMTSLFK